MDVGKKLIYFQNYQHVCFYNMHAKEIAEANGISSEAVVQTIVDVLTEKLNEAVSEGKITGDEALEKASHIRERAEEERGGSGVEGHLDRRRRWLQKLS